jgi:hypothetical protein
MDRVHSAGIQTIPYTENFYSSIWGVCSWSSSGSARSLSQDGGHAVEDVTGAEAACMMNRKTKRRRVLLHLQCLGKARRPMTAFSTSCAIVVTRL